MSLPMQFSWRTARMGECPLEEAHEGCLQVLTAPDPDQGDQHPGQWIEEREGET